LLHHRRMTSPKCWPNAIAPQTFAIWRKTRRMVRS
jgi:hypothetical protein